MGGNSFKPHDLDYHTGLLLLWLRCVGLLQLVLSLSRKGAWTESQIQRALRNAAVLGHGCLQSLGRSDWRLDHQTHELSPRALRHFRARFLVDRRFHYCGICRRRCTPCERGSRRRGWLALSDTKFVLGCFRRSWRQILRLGIRLDEHGKPVRRYAHGLSHAMARRYVWMECVISRSCGRFRSRSDLLAGG